jgi:hypothetical protein
MRHKKCFKFLLKVEWLFVAKTMAFAHLRAESYTIMLYNKGVGEPAGKF